jgi:hypothetical protein
MLGGPAFADMYPDGSNAKLPTAGTASAAVCQTSGGSLLAQAWGCPGIDPMQYGAVGNGVADDTNAVKAAAAAAVAKRLPLLITHLHKTAALDLTGGPIVISGSTRGGFRNGQQNDTLDCPVGFVPSATNIDGYIKLTGDSSISNLCINMLAPGTNTTGRAITNETVCDASATCPLGHDVTVSNVLINGPCIGIAFSGSYDAVLNNTLITNVQGTGCGGVRFGAFTNSNRSIQPILDHFIFFGSYGAATPPDYGVLILDAGGPLLTNNAVQTANYGLIVRPSVDLTTTHGSQNIQALSSSNNYWGDTNVSGGILIDALSGAFGFQQQSPNVFVNDWVSGGTNGLTIKNTAGGGTIVAGFVFTNFRATGFTGVCVLTSGAVSDIKLDMRCDNAKLGGVNIGSGTTDVRIHNSFFQNVSPFTPATMPYCVNFGAAPQRDVVVGNDFSLCTTPIAGTLPTGAGLSGALITKNLGLDGSPQTVASATSITLGEAPVVSLTGTTTVNTINGDPNVQYTFLCAAVITFATGGNLANAGTCSTALTATHLGSSWFLH